MRTAVVVELKVYSVRRNGSNEDPMRESTLSALGASRGRVFSESRFTHSEDFKGKITVLRSSTGEAIVLFWYL